MTVDAHPLHTDVLAANEEHLEVQRWRAARTVRTHLSIEDGQEDVLACLGLLDVVPTSRVGE
jgi:hypothetical protein